MPGSGGIRMIKVFDAVKRLGFGVFVRAGGARGRDHLKGVFKVNIWRKELKKGVERCVERCVEGCVERCVEGIEERC